MIEFKQLSHTSDTEILDCFNEAFSDYFIPFRFNLQQLKTKLQSESINKEISVGAFRNNRLIGLILHGERQLGNHKTAYNACTGVIPKERGQALTKRMYHYIMPVLETKKINEVVLEVISNNLPAITSYKKIGFKTTRRLHCFKGELITKELNKEIKIQTAGQIDFKVLTGFGEIQPTWQNAAATIVNLGEAIIYLLAYKGTHLCGYCMLNSQNNRILQIAVKKELRNKGIGSTLLHYIKNHISTAVSINNIDSSSEAALHFFESNNLSNFLTQEEMKLEINHKI